MRQGLTIIVPVRNERQYCDQLWHHLRSLDVEQIIICDGDSDDGSYHWLRHANEMHNGHPTVLIKQCHAGRARQMNHGAKNASEEVLVFMHADTQINQQALSELRQVLAQGAAWGRFSVAFHNPSTPLRVIAWFMNWRSSLSGICTGDQILFVRRGLFEQLGGYAEIALMEDIELTTRLRTICWPTCLHSTVTTSARRWQQNGVMRTVLSMWWLRLGYWLGASPEKLAQQYNSSD